MRKKMILTLAVTLIVSTTAAFGAVKESSFTVTPLIGGYVFDDGEPLGTSFLMGLRAGYNFTKHIGIEAVYDYATPKDGKSASLADLSVNRFGGQVLYHFFPDNVFVPYLAAGYSGLHYGGTGYDNKTHGAFDYGVGAKYFMTDDIALRGDLRHIMSRYPAGQTNDDFEFTLGAYFQFGGTKPAMKAVAPTPAPEPVQAVAPPAPAPVQAVVAPVVVPPADSDGDGVIDTLDKCPGTPAGVAVDGDGCPLDTDKDGVVDYLDKCPNTPVGVRVDVKGCPLDSDNDGVADYLDKCPGTPAGVTVDAKGCPVEVAKKFCDKPAVIAVSFDTNKADIKARYHVELDTLGNFLKEFPNSKGTIEGHTDADGSKAANLKLSQNRADSVRNYIITKFGIEASRLSAKGYGSAKPVASNKTAAGKTKNRRIEAIFSCE